MTHFEGKGWRQFQVPTGSGGLGQEHLWYTHDMVNEKFREEVQEYLQTGKLP